ncbi:MAG: VanZ family protein [Dehalococcoidia bacterium]
MTSRLKSPLWLLTFAWVAFVVYLALIPRIPRVPGLSDRMASSLGHFITHAVLASLIYLILVGDNRNRTKQWLAVIAALAVAFTFGTSLEFAQHAMPNVRALQVGDLADNTMGAIAGAVGAFMLQYLGLHRRYLVMMVGASCVAVIVAVMALVIARNPGYPYPGDHWHAAYTIEICGETLPRLPGRPGWLHTHGDGYIHVHPFTLDQGGGLATPTLFMGMAGGTLRSDTLTLPSGESYTNGDLCPDGRSGTVQVEVNDEPVSPGSYVIRDLDRVEIKFSP